MAIKGSCLCGNVAFEVKKFIGPFEICHCSRCRKVSGRQGVAGIGCHVADYLLIKGSEYIESFEAPILHRPPAYEVHFCCQFGSPVPPADPTGDFMEIAAGLLDDDPAIKPDKYIFIEYLPAWDSIADDLPQFTQIDLIKHRRANSSV